MDIRSYFRSASKSLVVSSSSDSEDGNESEIDVQPNPPKKHCSTYTSKPPSKSGSGIRRYNKNGKKILSVVRVQRKFRECILQIVQKGWKISSEDWWGVDYQTIY